MSDEIKESAQKVCRDCGKLSVIKKAGRCDECHKQYHCDMSKKRFDETRETKYKKGICEVCGKEMTLWRDDQKVHGKCMSEYKKSKRIDDTRPSKLVNNYKLIYKPSHPSGMKNDSYYGYIYEHKYIMETHLGRVLNENEVVHHIDGNKLNNDISNLKLITRAEHTSIHVNPNYGEEVPVRSCLHCSKPLSSTQAKFCSNDCKLQYDNPIIKSTKGEKPTKDELQALLDKKIPYLELGRMFNVSDNAVRKWAKAYGIFEKKLKKLDASITNDPNFKNDLENMINSGYSYNDICKHYDISHDTIYYWLNKFGLDKPEVQTTKSENVPSKEELELCLNEGLSLRNIAEKYNISHSTVLYWKDKYNRRPTTQS